MTGFQREATDGTVSKSKRHSNTSGKVNQHISTTHLSSKLPTKISLKLQVSKVPTLYVVSVIQLPLITSPQPVILRRNPQLPDSSSARVYNKVTSTLTVPEEETMRLWLEAPLPTQELLTN